MMWILSQNIQTNELSLYHMNVIFMNIHKREECVVFLVVVL